MNFPFSFGELTRAFLKNDILSIDIGFTNIKVAHIRKKSDTLIKVINFGIGDTPDGCIRNGIISDLDGIAMNLKNVIDAHGIGEKNVKIVISAGSNIISKVILIKKVAGKKAEESIKEEVTDLMPVDMYAQKLFYRITGEIEKDGMTYSRVLVTVVPNSTIDNYVRLLKQLNFKPLAIEIPFSSVARFFSKGVRVTEGYGGRHNTTYFSGTSEGATAIIDLGSETSNLSILNRGALEFNRVILTGGRQLDELISKKLGITREIAEGYKKIYGINDGKRTGENIERVIDDCAREYFGEIMDNIRRSIDFYVDRCGGQPVERIFFIGGGSGMKGLSGFSRQILKKPVYTVENMDFNNIEFEGYLDRDKLRFLINTLGLAM